MRTPELKKAILKMTGTNEFYGYEIHRELGEKNINVGIGRLYAILGEMKTDGLLKDRWEKSMSGPKRRVYRIASKGMQEREKILMEAIETVHDFYIEYLLSLPPELSAFNTVASLLTRGIRKRPNIAYSAPGISGSVKRLLLKLQEKRSQGNIYVVCPKTKGLEIDLEGVMVLDGTTKDIPTKDDYLDLLVVTGAIRKDRIDVCIDEWRRVVADKGRVALVIPTALVKTYEDPLGIGEFIEKREHPPVDDDYLDLEILKTALSRQFKTINEENVVHISVLTGTGTLPIERDRMLV